MSGDLWYKPKLIEVALPLEDINRESAREKSIRHGHPSTLHRSPRSQVWGLLLISARVVQSGACASSVPCR